MLQNIKVVGFDADDTLWVNEPYFQEAEKEFCQLFSDAYSSDEVSKQLFSIEMKNLPDYGYGAKAFTLSMVETALQLDENCSAAKVKQVLELGRAILSKPVVLLDGVHEVLSTLKNRFQLVVATKGDLLDQQRKLKRSGLEEYFHHVEIMSDKREDDYRKLVQRLAVEPQDFLMVGNSLKSDILPVVAIGGHAVYVPYHTTWQHEVVSPEERKGGYHTLESLSDFRPFL